MSPFALAWAIFLLNSLVLFPPTLLLALSARYSKKVRLKLEQLVLNFEGFNWTEIEGVLYLSSKDLSIKTGKEHFHILEKVRKYLSKLGIEFSSTGYIIENSMISTKFGVRTEIEGVLYLSSKDLSIKTKKRHDNILRDIRKYLSRRNSKFSSTDHIPPAGGIEGKFGVKIKRALVTECLKVAGGVI